ncbi:SRPBCC family protein [Streptomyces sp. JW3]|uniref:SRPBCC family protein n=1 Tax=Streptomyces sp. JW3 TaxID=3456955 RepID=UPI003FA4C5E8
MTARHTILQGLALAALATATTLAAPAAATAAPSSPFQRCGDVTVDQSAPVVSRASVLIKAPLKTVWNLHTDIDAWSAWIPEITPAAKQTPGPLRPGSVFTWSPQNMKVTSTVTEVRRLRCTAWGAPVGGIDGIHLFTFKPVKGGVLATTEESWSGAPVEADVPGNQAALDAGLTDWMNRLKATAETRTACAGGHR